MAISSYSGEQEQHVNHSTMKSVFVLLALALVAYAQDESQCVTVQPIRNFKYSGFEGRWFEVGHIKSAGASVWDDGCLCSYSNLTKDEAGEGDGDSIYSYVCNLDEEDGEQSVFETQLKQMSPPGQWKQTVIPGGVFDDHTFTVLDLTETYALTYRCGDYLVDDSYTIQFLSRKNSLDDATITKLKAKVTELGINPENSEYVQVYHNSTCAYNQ